MGLTIHYEMHAPKMRDPATARELVAKLRAHATALKFSNISKIMCGIPGAAENGRRKSDSCGGCKKPVGAQVDVKLVTVDFA